MDLLVTPAGALSGSPPNRWPASAPKMRHRSRVVDPRRDDPVRFPCRSGSVVVAQVRPAPCGAPAMDAAAPLGYTWDRRSVTRTNHGRRRMLANQLGAGALAAALVAYGLGPAAAQETLRALSMQPKAVTYTQSFLKFIDKLNEAGQGVVQIEFVGGPEAIPTFDQPEAVRAGVTDMIYGPGSYYAGIVPETDALVGSNVTPMEKRANGGIDLLNSIHQEKMNVYYLGHPDGG